MLSSLLSSLTVALFMLQSNDAIGQAIADSGLTPDYSQYTGFIGVFGYFFLLFISMFASFIPNYGIAIILTAVLVRVLLLPLTRKQITGMRMMQQLQPVMKEIQRYYPNKQDQSAKTMELYQKYKINPLSGCLPLLIQMPILFGVYRALYDPSFAGKGFLGIQLLFPVNVTSGRSFGMGPELMDLVDVTVAQLGLMSQIVRLPDGIPLIGGSFWYLPALVLVVFYVGSTLLMQRIMRKVNAPDPAFTEQFKEVMKSTKREEKGKPEPDMAQQMQRQMGIMNFVIIIFAFIFSAGALLYFIVQNLLMLLEYTYIPRLAGAGGPQLDPRELREFIRRPPPPLQQPGAKARPAQQGGEQAQSAAAGDGADAAGDQHQRIQEGAQQEPGADQVAPVRLKRPRKKRRKR